jgi:ubiquinone biosynthesis protein UbiJ
MVGNNLGHRRSGKARNGKAGGRMEIEALMAAMREKLPVLAPLGYRVLFNIDDIDGGILLDATGGRAKLSLIEADDAVEVDTTLKLSSENLAKLMNGKLSPMLAFSLGKLKVDGSKGVALKLASLLDED